MLPYLTLIYTFLCYFWLFNEEKNDFIFQEIRVCFKNLDTAWQEHFCGLTSQVFGIFAWK